MDKGLIVHVMVVNNRGQSLIMKRPSNDEALPGSWDIPGGTLNDGEDPALGAIRETWEECGLVIKDLRLFHFTSNVDSKKKQAICQAYFSGSNFGRYGSAQNR